MEDDEKEPGIVDNGYDPKKDLGAMVRFMNGVLDKLNTLSYHVDSQTNIIVGIGSAIFIFSSARYVSDREIYMFILSAFSALATMFSLLAIHPPRFMRKRGQEESLMYNKKISEFSSYADYAGALDDVLGDRFSMIKQYSVEIINLSKYYYRPKRKLFNIAKNLLLTGIVTSFAVFVAVEFFIK